MIRFDRKWDTGHNRDAYNTPVPFYKCPSAPELEETQTSSVGITGVSDSPLRGHYAAVLGAKVVCPTPPTPNELYTMDDVYGCSTGGLATNGIIYNLSKTKFRDIVDGTSKTLLIGEMSGDIGPVRTWIVGSADPPDSGWIYSGKNVFWPINFAKRSDPGVDNSDVSFSSRHIGGAHFALADGSARFIDENIELDLCKAMASRAGNEIVTIP